MVVSTHRLKHLGRLGQWILIGVAAVGVVALGVFLAIESRWVVPEFREPEEAFQIGSIGTEVMPLPVAQVLPELCPEHFQPAGKDRGNWVEQFGFLMPATDGADALPIGFALSNYRPQSAAPSPVPFVGFSCALCHSTHIAVDTADSGKVVYGPGSISLNLFAWLDAFQTALLEREAGGAGDAAYRVTAEKIAAAYAAKHGQPLGFAEQTMISVWLRQIRSRLEDGLPRFDEPFGHGRSRQPEFVPTGPTRTQPFRTLIRQALQRPGNDMPVYTKIATVFAQGNRQWAQFDGAIGDLNARSSMAAFAAGATVENMRTPEIAHNIRQASGYTRSLRPPSFAQLFPKHAAALAPEKRQHGAAVYRQHCFSCHGDRDRDGGTWTAGPRQEEIAPLGEIGTDPERVMFRHYGELGGRLFELFPPDHPFHIPREKLRPLPGDEENLAKRGYVNAAIDGAFLRGPYLHNASVLTLAELINLKPRRAVFFRGRNFYDPEDVGFRSPDGPDARHYFRFDTSLRGNSNRGHDYPWRYDDPQRNEDDLRALLDYLKTL